jgi:hypothetical protein
MSKFWNVKSISGSYGTEVVKLKISVACEPGYYCANDRLNDTSGQCDAGYYCTSLADQF